MISLCLTRDYIDWCPRRGLTKYSRTDKGVRYVVDRSQTRGSGFNDDGHCLVQEMNEIPHVLAKRPQGGTDTA